MSTDPNKPEAIMPEQKPTAPAAPSPQRYQTTEAPARTVPAPKKDGDK